MKSAKQFVWLALLVFILAELMLCILPGIGTAGPGRFSHGQYKSEPLLSACFFSFISLLYFIPEINRLWKVPIYGLLVTLFCLLIFGYSFDLMEAIEAALHGKPFRLFSENHFSLSWHLVGELSVFSLSFNIASLVVLCPYYCLIKRYSSKTNDLPYPAGGFPSKIIFPHNIKLTLFAGAIYIGFIIIYDIFIRPAGPMVMYNMPTGEGSRLRGFILGYIVTLYGISFFSLLIFLPLLIGRMKQGVAYCALIPLFWNVVILAVYAVMTFFTSWNTEFFREDIFTLHYYVGRYVETRAWSISFPLLAIWGFCHWLTRAEQNKQAEHSANQLAG